MPVEFEINKKTFAYPEGWEDVTLETFLKYLEDVQYKKPEVLKNLQEAKNDTIRKEILDGIDYDFYGTELLPFYLKYVSFWTNCDSRILGSLKKEVIETLYDQIRINFGRSLKNSKNITQAIEHNGETWYLPTKHMQKSTVNEFIELSQYEHNARQLKKDNFSVLPEMLCILLKKKINAPYNPECLKRKPIFKKMTMDKVFKVSFFLSKLNMRLKNDFLIYTAAERLNYLQSKNEQVQPN